MRVGGSGCSDFLASTFRVVSLSSSMEPFTKLFETGPQISPHKPCITMIPKQPQIPSLVRASSRVQVNRDQKGLLLAIIPTDIHLKGSRSTRYYVRGAEGGLPCLQAIEHAGLRQGEDIAVDYRVLEGGGFKGGQMYLKVP